MHSGSSALLLLLVLLLMVPPLMPVAVSLPLQVFVVNFEQLIIEAREHCRLKPFLFFCFFFSFVILMNYIIADVDFIGEKKKKTPFDPVYQHRRHQGIRCAANCQGKGEICASSDFPKWLHRSIHGGVMKSQMPKKEEIGSKLHDELILISRAGRVAIAFHRTTRQHI